jgi:hypothetical protein
LTVGAALTIDAIAWLPPSEMNSLLGGVGGELLPPPPPPQLTNARNAKASPNAPHRRDIDEFI